MRPNYPISSKEMMYDFNNIQEALLSLIGYDNNPFDDVIDKNGELIELQNDVDIMTTDILNNRLYNDMSYQIYYKNNLISNYVRGVKND